MIHVNLAADFQIRRGQVLAWPPEDWRRVRGPVRVVFDDEAAARPVLRALMARDREVELLDVDGLRYGWLAYNKAPVRKALEAAKVPNVEPWVIWTSRDWALDVIERLAQ